MVGFFKFLFGFFKNEYKGFTPAEIEILKRLERDPG